MSTNLPISRLIDVSVNLSPLAAQAQDLSVLLLLGTDDVIDVIERLRTYSTLADVAADFGTVADEYLASTLWFQQAPQPTEIKIGRWANAATAARLVGGGVSNANQLIAAWTVINDGAFRIPMRAVQRSITGCDFSLVTSLNGVAAVIQAKLAAQVAGTTCVWDSVYQRFLVNVGGTAGVTSTVGFVTYPPAAQGYFLFTANPANLDTITLNGTVVTFVASGAVGNQINIGADLAETLDNLVTFLEASVDVQLVKFTYALAGAQLNLQAVATGAAGNALTLAEASTSITRSGATLTGGTGTDVSAMLAMLSTSSGCYIADGIAAETALAAATLFDLRFGQTWYGLNFPSDMTNDDHIAVAGFIEAATNKHLYGATTQEAGAVSSVSTTDLPYLLKQLGYDKTMVQYSSENAHAVCSLFGRALTVDYNGNSTVITLMYKQEPGIVAEELNSNQVGVLETKNCNVFVAYNNNTAIIEQGKVCSGDFIDTITGADWLAITIMTALYNLLYTSTTKIPQTDAGTHLLTTTCESVLSQAVRNGFLAPGVWNANGFGTLAQGDFLPKGWYVYAPPVSQQLQADREARRSVPIQIAAKLAGAVHTVDVAITVNR